jgi:hypothetical protein
MFHSFEAVRVLQIRAFSKFKLQSGQKSREHKRPGQRSVLGAYAGATEPEDKLVAAVFRWMFICTFWGVYYITKHDATSHAWIMDS